MLASVLAACPGSASAQNTAVNVPRNAHAFDNGRGWECDHGYRTAREECIAIMVPENAYAVTSTYGAGWQCTWGYRQVGEACVPVAVPKNAYLVSSARGRGWECERGFRERAGSCIQIEVPPNAYLRDSAYGRGWECERGYRAVVKACIDAEKSQVRIDEPSDEDLKCQRAMRQDADICLRVVIPDNGYLEESGQGWKCALR
jgi:hypothetical protein